MQTVTSPVLSTAAQALNPVQALGDAALPALAQAVPDAQTTASPVTKRVQTAGQAAVPVVTQPVQAILPAAAQTLNQLAPSGAPTAAPSRQGPPASPALAAVAEAIPGVG